MVRIPTVSTALRRLYHVAWQPVAGLPLAASAVAGFALARFGPIRVLGPRDTGRIIAHFIALSAEDRMARFNGYIDIYGLAHRYRALDWRHVRLTGYLRRGKIIALSEEFEATLGGRPAREIALSVATPRQGTHLGERLLRDAIRRVCKADRLPLVLITQTDNPRMIHLCRKLGGQIEHDSGELRVVFPAA